MERERSHVHAGSSILLMASLKHADDRRTMNEKPSEDTRVTYCDPLFILKPLPLLQEDSFRSLFWERLVDAKAARSQAIAVCVLSSDWLSKDAREGHHFLAVRNHLMSCKSHSVAHIRLVFSLLQLSSCSHPNRIHHVFGYRSSASCIT